MLEDLIHEHGTSCWLVNTGWVGGKYGVGSRISLQHTRAIIDAIHSGILSSTLQSSPLSSSSLSPVPTSHNHAPEPTSSPSSPQVTDPEIEWKQYRAFGLAIPTSVPDVPSEILNPSKAWADEDAFDRERIKLVALFRRAFRMFEHDVSDAVRRAGPTL